MLTVESEECGKCNFRQQGKPLLRTRIYFGSTIVTRTMAISWKYPNTQLNFWLWTRMFKASMMSIGIFIVYQTGNLIELHMSSYRKNNINHSKTSLINKERYKWKRRILRNENANMNWNLLIEEKKEYKDDTRKCEWVR